MNTFVTERILPFLSHKSDLLFFACCTCNTFQTFLETSTAGKDLTFSLEEVNLFAKSTDGANVY